MTTKAAGRIIIYSDDGEIHRWVDADDVAALEQAYRAACAIMRSNPVGVPERLVKAWQAAAVKVEGKR